MFEEEISPEELFRQFFGGGMGGPFGGPFGKDCAFSLPFYSLMGFCTVCMTPMPFEWLAMAGGTSTGP